MLFGSELIPRRFGVESHPVGKDGKRTPEHALFANVLPAENGSVEDRRVRADDNGRSGGAQLRTEPVTRRTPPESTVERKVMRREFFKARSAAVARIVLREAAALGPGRATARTGVGTCIVVDRLHEDDAVADGQGLFDRIGDARALVRANDDAVNHEFDHVTAAVVDGNLGVVE